MADSRAAAHARRHVVCKAAIIRIRRARRATNNRGIQMEITASMVKELRERSGAGMMECKKALTENQGNLDSEIEWLRKQGLAKADKKASRVAAEGRIAMAQDAGKAVLVEINSETDFVAKDENFTAFA